MGDVAIEGLECCALTDKKPQLTPGTPFRHILFPGNLEMVGAYS